MAQGMLLAGWVVLGAVLALAGLLAWTQADLVRGWIRSLQDAYGAGPNPAWPMRADAHVHMLVSCIATIWFGAGCRLFAPRTLPWLAIALTVILALSDELAQLGSTERSFEWGDQAGDAVGLILAIPILLLLRRMELTGYRAAASSSATSKRS